MLAKWQNGGQAAKAIDWRKAMVTIILGCVGLRV